MEPADLGLNDLIEKHKEFVSIMNDEYVLDEERQKATENARFYADKIEKLGRIVISPLLSIMHPHSGFSSPTLNLQENAVTKKKCFLSVQSIDKEEYSKEIRVWCEKGVKRNWKKEDPASCQEGFTNTRENNTPPQADIEKNKFLKIFNLAPRSIVDGQPTNRKSKRKPAPKLTNYYALERNFLVPVAKKRIVRKKAVVEVPRPSSVPIISTNLPNRFITETMVTCDACNEPFKIHHVNPLPSCNVLPVPRICFVCQVSRTSEQT